MWPHGRGVTLLRVSEVGKSAAANIGDCQAPTASPWSRISERREPCKGSSCFKLMRIFSTMGEAALNYCLVPPGLQTTPRRMESCLASLWNVRNANRIAHRQIMPHHMICFAPLWNLSEAYCSCATLKSCTLPRDHVLPHREVYAKHTALHISKTRPLHPTMCPLTLDHYIACSI
jgi:hypothetical protein